MNGLVARPRYHIIHKWLWNSAGDIGRPILRSRFYFIDKRPQDLLPTGCFSPPQNP